MLDVTITYCCLNVKSDLIAIGPLCTACTLLGIVAAGCTEGTLRAIFNTSFSVFGTPLQTPSRSSLDVCATQAQFTALSQFELRQRID